MDDGDGEYGITIHELEVVVDEIYRYGADKILGEFGLNKVIKNLRTDAELGIPLKNIQTTSSSAQENDDTSNDGENSEIERKKYKRRSNALRERKIHFGMNQKSDLRKPKKKKKFDIPRFWKLPYGKICCNFRLCILFPLIFLSLVHMILSIILPVLREGNPENTAPAYLGWIEGFLLFIIFNILFIFEFILCIYGILKSIKRSYFDKDYTTRRRRNLLLQPTNEDEPDRRTFGGNGPAKKYKVTRGGETKESTLIYPGDILLIRSGQIIPGDGLLLEGFENFQTNENVITGSPHFVSKTKSRPLLLSQTEVVSGEGKMLMLIPENMPHEITIYSKHQRQFESDQRIFISDEDTNTTDTMSLNHRPNPPDFRTIIMDKTPPIMKKAVKQHIKCSVCFGASVSIAILFFLLFFGFFTKFLPYNTWTGNFVPDERCSNTTYVILNQGILNGVDYCGSIGYDILIIVEYILMISALLLNLHPRMMMFLYNLSRLDMLLHFMRKGLRVREAGSVERFALVDCIVIGDGVLTQENLLKIDKVWLAGREWEAGLPASSATSSICPASPSSVGAMDNMTVDTTDTHITTRTRTKHEIAPGIYEVSGKNNNKRKKRRNSSPAFVEDTNNNNNELNPQNFSKEMCKKEYTEVRQILIEAFSTVCDASVSPIIPLHYFQENSSSSTSSSSSSTSTSEKESKPSKTSSSTSENEKYEDINRWRCQGDRLECSTLVFLAKSFGIHSIEKDMRYVRKKFLYTYPNHVKSVVLCEEDEDEEDEELDILYCSPKRKKRVPTSSSQENIIMKKNSDDDDGGSETSTQSLTDSEKEVSDSPTDTTNNLYWSGDVVDRIDLQEEIIEIQENNYNRQQQQQQQEEIVIEEEEEEERKKKQKKKKKKQKEKVFRVYVYGDAITVIGKCDHLQVKKDRLIFQYNIKASYQEKMRYDASQGLRTTAIAYKYIPIIDDDDNNKQNKEEEVEDDENSSKNGHNNYEFNEQKNSEVFLEHSTREDFESGLTLLGLFGARVTVPPSISKSVLTLRKAEIPVVYLTKFPEELAKTVAEGAGIWDGYDERVTTGSQLMSLTNKYNRLFHFCGNTKKAINGFFDDIYHDEDEDDIHNKKKKKKSKKKIKKSNEKKMKAVKRRLDLQTRVIRNLRVVSECQGEEKLNFVRSLRMAGRVCLFVSSLGPGNDACAALKEADIGVCTSRCSERAKHASDIVVNTNHKGRTYLGIDADEIMNLKEYDDEMDDDNILTTKNSRKRTKRRRRRNNFFDDDHMFAKSNQNLTRLMVWCMMRGRMIHENLKRYAHFQLTSGLVLGFFVLLTSFTRYFPLQYLQTYSKNSEHQYPFVHNEMVFTPLQLFLVGLFVEVVGGLSYITEKPFKNVLKRKLSPSNSTLTDFLSHMNPMNCICPNFCNNKNKKKPSRNRRLKSYTYLVDPKIVISVFIQCCYELFVLIFLYYGGIWITTFEVLTVGDLKTARWAGPSASQVYKIGKYVFLSHDEDVEHHHRMTYRPKVRATLVFYTFFLFQIFNLINSRRIGGLEWCICGNLMNSCTLCCSVFFSCCGVFFIVCVGYMFAGYVIFHTTGLEWYNFVIPIFFALGSTTMHFGFNLFVRCLNIDWGKICCHPCTKNRKRGLEDDNKSPYTQLRMEGNENSIFDDLDVDEMVIKSSAYKKNKKRKRRKNRNQLKRISFEGKEEFIDPQQGDDHLMMMRNNRLSLVMDFSDEDEELVDDISDFQDDNTTSRSRNLNNNNEIIDRYSNVNMESDEDESEGETEEEEGEGETTSEEEI